MWQEQAESRCRCGGVDAHNRAEQDGERPTRLERDCHPLCTRAEQYDDTTSVRDRLRPTARVRCAVPCLVSDPRAPECDDIPLLQREVGALEACAATSSAETSHGCAVGQRPRSMPIGSRRGGVPRGRKRTSTRWTSGASGSAARQRVSAAPTLSGCGCRDALRTALCVECADHVRALDGLLEVREYRRPAAAQSGLSARWGRDDDGTKGRIGGGRGGDIRGMRERKDRRGRGRGWEEGRGRTEGVGARGCCRGNLVESIRRRSLADLPAGHSARDKR